MKTILCHVPLVVLLLSPFSGYAEEAFDPVSRAEKIAPFIDAETVAVGHADLRAVEVGPLMAQLVKLVPEAQPQEEEARANLDRVVSAFRQSGLVELYVVADQDLLKRPPVIIAPVAGRPNVKALLERLELPAEASQEMVEHFEGALAFGSPQSLRRLKAMQPDPRPELVEAFRAAGDTAAQLAILPTADHRRVIEEMLPELPKEIGGGPSTILTRGFLWAALGANLPPQPSLRLVIQSQDSAAATALHGKWVEAARLLAKREDLPKPFRLPNLDKVASLLRPNVEGDRLVLSLDQPSGTMTALLEAFTPPLEDALDRTRSVTSSYNLKRIALGLHNYYDTYKSFPAQANYDASGKPLLSWRVHILPYVDHVALYRQFRLDEPWDSEHNRALVEKMPEVYRSPASKLEQKGLTSYVLPVGEETICPGHKAVRFRDILDGTSNTILAVEVDDDHAVIWTKPEDLPFDPDNPAKGLGKLYDGKFHTTFCDGAVWPLPATLDPEKLRALFTRAGREVVRRDEIPAPW